MLLHTQIEALRIQARFIVDFDADDVPKRIANAAVGLAVLAYFGVYAAGVSVFASIILLELVASWARRRAPREVSAFSHGLIVLVYLRVILAVALFALMAVLILMQPSQLAMAVGLMFLTGTIIHSLTSHALINGLNWATSVVFALAMFAFSITFATVDYARPSAGEQKLLVYFCVLWVVAMVMTVHRGRRTRLAYSGAIASAKRRADLLNYQAGHDMLTGLMNRRAFDEVASDTLLFGGRAAVLLLDLDGFKPINDTFGHAAGDAILTAIGARLRDCAAPHLVARIGGDEFAILMRDVDGPEPLDALVDSLQTTLPQPVIFDGMPISVGVSIGRAVQDPETLDLDSLCRKADSDMYRVKSRRKRRADDRPA